MNPLPMVTLMLFFVTNMVVSKMSPCAQNFALMSTMDLCGLSHDHNTSQRGEGEQKIAIAPRMFV